MSNNNLSIFYEADYNKEGDAYDCNFNCSLTKSTFKTILNPLFSNFHQTTDFLHLMFY